MNYLSFVKLMKMVAVHYDNDVVVYVDDVDVDDDNDVQFHDHKNDDDEDEWPMSLTMKTCDRMKMWCNGQCLHQGLIKNCLIKINLQKKPLIITHF